MFPLGIILAAGAGLRMRPLTEATPKPLLTIQGRTLLEHQISFLSQFVTTIGVTVGYMSEQVEKTAKKNGASLILNSNGQGNAFWMNSPIIRSVDYPIVVITCDNLMEFDYGALESESNMNRNLSYLLTRKAPLEMLGDRVLERNGKIIEVSSDTKTDLMATGLQVINPSHLKPVCTYDDFHDVWSDLIENGTLCNSTVAPKKWSAIDTPADLQEANRG